MKWIQAYVSGKTPKLERDTIIYMQAGDEGYDNTDPTVVESPVSGSSPAATSC